MDRDAALGALLLRLKALGYDFVTVTPATHARVLSRPLERSPTLRDIFGWNRSFAEEDVGPELLALMQAAEILQPAPRGWRSAVRVAALGGDLFLHSGYPTDEADAVFFGPDTYRFARFLAQQLPRLTPTHVVDMGAGSGAGGIFAARLAPSASITLVDTNPAALALAKINAAAAGVAAGRLQASACPAGAGLVIANPPYMIDESRRAYRDGGELYGGQVALDWVRDALGKVRPGGAVLLYTGVAVVDGAAPFTAALARTCARAGASLDLEELDPDVFGEELEQPAYRHVERIAAIGAVIRSAG